MAYCGGFAQVRRGQMYRNDMPSTTCYNRIVRWRKAGVWDRILADISKSFDGDIIMIDSSCVRVHQHGATAKKGALTMAAWDVPVAD